MKKVAAFSLVLALAAATLSAQTGGLTGYGLGWLFQEIDLNGPSGRVEASAGSAALDVESLMGKSFGLYSGLGLGCVLAADVSEGGAEIPYRLTDMNMAFAVNSLIGLGYRAELGPLALLLGAGAGLDVLVVGPKDLAAPIASLTVGAGGAATVLLRLSADLSLDIGLRALWGVFQPLSGGNAFGGSLSLLPHLGLAF